MMTYIYVNSGSGKRFVPGPMLTYHQWIDVDLIEKPSSNEALNISSREMSLKKNALLILH